MKHGHVIAAACCAALAAPASAQHGVVDHYTARLSAQDHFNSNGQRLTTVAAIIRQDRANVHRFGAADNEDEGDRFFGVAANRAALERMIARGKVSPAVQRAIVNGQPLIHVDIYDGWIEVTLL